MVVTLFLGRAFSFSLLVLMVGVVEVHRLGPAVSAAVFPYFKNRTDNSGIELATIIYLDLPEYGICQ